MPVVLYKGCSSSRALLLQCYCMLMETAVNSEGLVCTYISSCSLVASGSGQSALILENNLSGLPRNQTKKEWKLTQYV